MILCWMLDVFRAECSQRPKTPADVTPAMANEYKRRRAEAKVSPWSIKGDLATLKAVFGKWLGRELWFARVEPFRQRETAESAMIPTCVSSRQTRARRFSSGWGSAGTTGGCPLVYLEVLRPFWAGEPRRRPASGRRFARGRIRAGGRRTNCKTRRYKYGWLPAGLVRRSARHAAAGRMGFRPVLGRLAPIAHSCGSGNPTTPGWSRSSLRNGWCVGFKMS
jgi:hypothetical protein